jgi:hypothetical protein
MSARQAKKFNDHQHRLYMYQFILNITADALQTSIAKKDWPRVASVIERTKSVLKGIRTNKGLRSGIFPMTRFTQFIHNALDHEVVKNG